MTNRELYLIIADLSKRAGTFDGWQPDDSTGRAFVPGKVAVLEADGLVSSREPQEVASPFVIIERIDWAEFIRFVWCGEYYDTRFVWCGEYYE